MNKSIQIAADKNVEGAIFASVGPGTSNFTNLKITMQPGIMHGQKGKHIEFKNGRYVTKNLEEIKFLKHKEANPIVFSKIKCIQDYDDKKENKKVGE
jgi:hypothetical protein